MRPSLSMSGSSADTQSHHGDRNHGGISDWSRDLSLAAAKCMKDVGFKVTVLERTGDVGGLWAYRDKKYGVMKFTHINVSKHNYCFSDYPVPEDAPDYLHHTELAEYIQGYVQHFHLSDDIKFHRQVNKVERREEEETWMVHAELVTEDKDGVITPTGKLERYECKYLAIASGHHSKPTYPNFPGQDTFTGKAYHSVDYKDAAYNDVKGKRVVLVGIGNSAVDAACNIASVGQVKPVYMSSRSGAWVVPNYLLGSPTDHYACRFFLSLPWRLGTFVLESVIALITGHPKKWNLNPKMHALQTQPTVSPTLIHHLQRKEIVIKPNIKKIDGQRVIFEDGTAVEADQLIFCTGYSIDLPFLPPDITKHFIDPDTNSISLYKNAFSTEIGHTLAFIGFVQPASGGVMTMSEIQARWWAELCRNHVLLPLKDEMKADIEKEMAYVRSRWFHSKRHTIQRDPIIYNDEVASFFGAKPEIMDKPSMAWRLLLGSCGASQWRLKGPGKWDKAEQEVKKVPVTGFLLYGAIFMLVFIFWLLWYLLSVITYQIFG